MKEGGVAVSLYFDNRLTYKINKGKEYSLPERNPASDLGHSQLSRKGAPRCPRLRAVFTLEAAVILPLVACFFVSILFFFRVMQVQLEVQKALNDTGRTLAVTLSGDNSNEVIGLGEAKALFLKEMSGRKVAERYISGGSLGISLLKSEFPQDEIYLRASYHVKLPIRIFWVWDFDMEQRADCRKWTGWNGAAGSGTGDTWVYVTETGTVYHTKSTCTHLELSIQSVGYDQLAVLRNEDGGKYRKCAQCGTSENAFGRVYITNQGDCYHTDLGCSGIKRTVYMVRLSEVGSRGACSRCGM